MTESSEVAITTVTSILIITNMVGNSLVCAVAMRNRDMRLHTCVFRLNLTFFKTTNVESSGYVTTNFIGW